MFERVKVDNVAAVQTVAVPVELVLDDGRELRGKFFAAQGRGVFDILNGGGGFLEFEPYGGERSIIAKTSIRQVRIVAMPDAGQMSRRLNALDPHDPHTVLGLKPGATLEDVKAAYHRLAKIYHPDRYATAELPPEVTEYLSAMARRINLAFAALEKPMMQEKRAAAARSEPVYKIGRAHV